MPRKPRLHVPEGIYHATLRGNNRAPLFFDPGDRYKLEALLSDGLQRYGCRVHAYCWMTNHVHLAVQIKYKPLGNLIQWVGSSFAKAFNRRYGRSGHVFERRHRAILINSDEQLLALVRYIHRNPVVANMVAEPDDYQWSSHGAYLGRAAVPWLTTEFVLKLFGESERRARANFLAFMGEESDALLEKSLEDGTANDPRVADNSAPPELVDAPAALGGPRQTLDELVAAVCDAHGTQEEALRSVGRSRRYAAIRTEIAVVALDEGIASLAEAARRFGRADGVLCRALSRYRQNSRRRLVK